MKKLAFFIFLGACILNKATAQSFENIDWQGKKVPAMAIDVYQSPAVTEQAVKELFEKMGYYAKVVKGILSYKSILIKDIDAKTAFDVLLKVEKKNKQEKDVSVVYLSMAKDYDNYIKQSSEKDLIEGMKSFATKFQNVADEKALELEIKDQEEKAKIAEKKLSTLKEEKASIENKIKKLEERKVENSNEIVRQEQEVENQRKALKILTDKKKL
jgi:hypothetical protein